jgi:hypothetical protein
MSTTALPISDLAQEIKQLVAYRATHATRTASCKECLRAKARPERFKKLHKEPICQTT